MFAKSLFQHRVVPWSLSLLAGLWMQAAGAASFDRQAWQDDFAQLKQELAAAYANLDWVINDRKVMMKPLLDRTGAALANATSDEQAARALRSFLDAFADGHVRLDPPKAGNGGDDATMAKSCADLGYQPPRNEGVSFERLAGYHALDNADVRDFPAGVVQTENGRRLGVLRIGLFSEYAFPLQCERVHPRPAACDEKCADRIFAAVGKSITEAFTRQLRSLESEKIDALVVDITGNGGGTDWADAVAQIVTGPGLVAPRMLFIKHPHWVQQFEQQLAEVDSDLKRSDISAAQRSLLQSLRPDVAKAREVAAEQCDRSAVWEGGKVCPLAVSGFIYSTGLYSGRPAVSLDGLKSAETIYHAGEYQFEAGIYQGPLAVLINGNTGSAAELFAATLKDNGRATLIGTPSVGSGCGYTNDGIAITLKNSRLRLRIPDCARLRANGRNEVEGLDPDVMVPWRNNDSAHQRAMRLSVTLEQWAKALPEKVKR